MTASEVSSAVRALQPRFLDGVAASDLSGILSAASVRRFLANSVITNQGHPANHLFLILEGRARSFYMTSGGQTTFFHWLPAGEMFGAMALLPHPSEYLVSTQAVRDARLLIWERSRIRSFTSRYPRLLENALAIASDYMNAYLAMHVSLTCHTARQRLAEVLVNFASGIGHKVPGGVELSIRNEELATAANVTPFTASRTLSEWQRTGLIVKSRGKLLLRAPERLLLHEI